jgi:hypothetical protein
MNETEYMLPKIDDTDIDPQTFECTRSRISLDLCLILGKETLTCLPRKHPMHTPCFSIMNSKRHVTNSL